MYDVVYDECQDGNYDAPFDAKFTEAFRVVVPVDAPVIDLGAGKEAAQDVADTAEAAEKVLGAYGKVKALGRLGAARDRLETR